MEMNYRLLSWVFFLAVLWMPGRSEALVPFSHGVRPVVTLKQRVATPASTSRLFSNPSVPSPPPTSSASVGTGAAADATYQNVLFRIPILGFFFKGIASIRPPSRSTLINCILAVLLMRMWWKYSIPNWVKKDVYKVLPRRWRPQGQIVTGSDRAAPESLDDSGKTGLFSLPTLASKMGTLLNMAKEQLQSPLEGFPLQGALLATLKVMDKKGTAAEEWNAYYSSAGEPYIIDDPTEFLDSLHLSDWAYLEETSELRRYLKGLNFTLVRHVKTDEPGRVGHYVAIDPEQKLALITVKGTSELNDMITDACGVPVRHNLTSAYGEESPLHISCHEGVLTASLDLADDVQPLVEELLVPSGYRVRLIGHSLGAGVACMTALLLRSRLVQHRNLLDVYAFAPPPILNYDAAVACRDFCTSIVNHGDVIPRASLPNLVALLNFLSLVNERLEERNLSPKGPKAMISLWQTLQQKNLTVMTPTEVFSGLQEAVSEIDLQDMDHLFCPGKVIMLFRKLKMALEEDQEEMEIESASILSDGSCQLLRHMDVDAQMLSDHMPDAYEKTLLGMGPVTA